MSSGDTSAPQASRVPRLLVVAAETVAGRDLFARLSLFGTPAAIVICLILVAV